MQLEAYSQLKWAYQLHYYVCFQSHRRQPEFVTDERVSLLQRTLADVCDQHGYHLLESKLYADHVRCLLSLRPDEALSTVIQKIKGNLSREYGISFAGAPPLWARGYLARSVGRVRIEGVRRYLESQAEHHGYGKRPSPPVFHYRASAPASLTAAHAVFDLTHHLVFATRSRTGAFDSALGKALTGYWLRVAAKRGFALEQISIVPDHIHLMVKTVPRLSVEQCALALMNNGQYFCGNHFPSVLINAGIDRLWQPGAYAGTCGEITTALLKSFLSRPS